LTIVNLVISGANELEMDAFGNYPCTKAR